MFSYRDMTFCRDANICATMDCRRRFTAEDEVLAQDWPVCYGSFASTCDKFTIKDEVKNEHLSEAK